MKENRETRKCRHFNGVALDHAKKCAAGICYRTLVGGPTTGWFQRIPCLGDEGPERVKCGSYARRTPEEIAQRWREMNETFARLMIADPLVASIKKKHPRGTAGNGSDPCPAKCGGTVHWRIAAINSHVWMRCTTENCIAFME